AEQERARRYSGERGDADASVHPGRYALVEHDRPCRDRQCDRQQRGEARNRERAAALIADLEKDRPGEIAEDERHGEDSAPAALRRALRRDVAGRETEAAAVARRRPGA